MSIEFDNEKISVKARIIAFYLPQFHPIDENNEWWGKGFTEWTNVGRAKPLFKGHYQPRVPADLGYYDLRMLEVREAQAEMAAKAGIFGFCYWHYWFGGGRQLLEKPFNEVLISGKPDFPFCLGWANESWESKIWSANDTKKNRVLIEQKYLGEEDNELHFMTLLSAFKDSRYIKIDDKPVFLIYKPEKFKDIGLFIRQWNDLAIINGIQYGFHFIAHTSSFLEYDNLIKCGFDSITVNPMSRVINKMKVIEYKDAIKYFINKDEDSIHNVIPTIMPNWDHSPRSGRYGYILHNSTPKLFEKCVKDALTYVKKKPEANKIIFLKSWNEWGEGNYIEPDKIYGYGYLDAIKRAISNS